MRGSLSRWRSHRRRLVVSVAASALAVMLAMGATASAQAPQPVLEFVSTHETTSTTYRYATEYLDRLCADIGRRCTLRSLPGRRSEAMLQAGSIVGEVGRVKAYIEKHPDYIVIDESFLTAHSLVFTRKSHAAIDSWEALERQARSVAYKRGIYVYQDRLEAMRPQVRPHDVQSVLACLQMVLTDRDDACIFDDGSLSDEGRAMLKQGRIGRPLDQQALYIYLGKGQEALAQTFTHSARRLRAQGVPAQLRRKYYDGK